MATPAATPAVAASDGASPEVTALKQTVKTLQADLDAARSTITDLKKQNSAHQLEQRKHQALKLFKSGKQKTQEELVMELEVLRSRLEELEFTEQQSSVQLQSLKDHVRSMSDANATLTADAKKAKERIAELERGGSPAIGQLVQTQSSSNLIQTSAAAETEKLQSQVDALNKAAQDHASRTREMEAQLRSDREAIARMEAQLARAREMSSGNVKELQDKLAAVESQLRDATSKIEEQSASADAQSKIILQLNQRKTQLEAGCKSLLETRGKLEAENETLKDENSRMTTTVTNLKSQLSSALSPSPDSAPDPSPAHEQELASLRADLEAAQSELAAARAALATSKGDLAGARAQLDEARHQISSSQEAHAQQIESLSARVADVTSRANRDAEAATAELRAARESAEAALQSAAEAKEGAAAAESESNSLRVALQEALGQSEASAVTQNSAKEEAKQLSAQLENMRTAHVAEKEAAQRAAQMSAAAMQKAAKEAEERHVAEMKEAEERHVAAMAEAEAAQKAAQLAEEAAQRQHEKEMNEIGETLLETSHKHQKQVAELMEEQAVLQEKAAKAAEAMKEKEAIIQESTAKIASLESEIAALQKTVDASDEAWNAKSAELATAIRNAEAAADEKVKALEEKSAADADVIAYKNKTINEQNDELTAVKAENARLAPLTDRVASLEGELEALQADLATRMEALEVQVTRAEEAEAALEVGRVRQAELEKEIEQVTAAKTELESQTESISAATADLTERLSTAESSLATATRDLHDKESALNEANNADRKKTMLIRDLQKQLDRERKSAAAPDNASTSSSTAGSGSPAFARQGSSFVAPSPSGELDASVLADENCTLIQRLADMQDTNWRLEEQLRLERREKERVAGELAVKAALLRQVGTAEAQQQVTGGSPSKRPKVTQQEFNRIHEANVMLQGILEDVMGKSMKAEEELARVVAERGKE